MSEKLRDSPEKAVESIDTSVQKHNNLEKLKRQTENVPEVNVENIRHKVETEAASGKEITVGERQSNPQMVIDRVVKNRVKIYESIAPILVKHESAKNSPLGGKYTLIIFSCQTKDMLFMCITTEKKEDEDFMNVQIVI